MNENGRLTSQDFDQIDSQLGGNSLSQASLYNRQPIQNVNYSQQNRSILSNIVNSPLVQEPLGAGDAIRNTIASGLNMVPGVNIPMVQSGQGTPYNVGKFAGNALGFMGGGDIADAVRAAYEGAPAIGKAASYLGQSGMIPSLLRRASGSAIYGGISNPSDRLKNAAQGAAFSSGLDLIPGAANLIGKAFNYFNPEEYAQGIRQSLGAGQDLTSNAQSIANSVRNSYLNRINEGKALYESVFNSVPTDAIYSGEIGAGVSEGARSGLGQYPNLSQDVLNSYDNKLNSLHSNFITNPNLENAHNLRSQLGSNIRSLQKIQNKGMLDAVGRSNLDNLNFAKDSLSNDMNNYLSNVNPDISNAYQEANKNWAQNVSPYMRNSAIAQMSKGDLQNISRVNSVFKNPSSNINKVVSDLPQDAVNKILYTQLGRYTPSKSAQGLVNSFNRLDQAGYSPYITPHLENQIGTLKNKISATKGFQTALGGGAGAVLADKFGLSPEIMGGIGAVALPRIANFVNQILPLEPIRQAIAKGSQLTYPYASRSILANLLNNSGVQNNGA